MVALCRFNDHQGRSNAAGLVLLAYRLERKLTLMLMLMLMLTARPAQHSGFCLIRQSDSAACSDGCVERRP